MYGILHVTAGPDQGRMLQVLPGKTLTLGRRVGDSDGLNDPHISRRHCLVKFENDTALLTDCGTASGTLVNGERVTERELKAGDVIQIGLTQLSFRWTRGDEMPTGPWQPGDQ
jgi:pSer/pThr/pTyr-binding forkhead associated (FHA) protein